MLITLTSQLTDLPLCVVAVMIAPPVDLAVSSPVSLLTLQTLGSLDL